MPCIVVIRVACVCLSVCRHSSSLSPIRNGFIVILSRQHLSSHCDTHNIHQQHNPRNGTQNPTLIQFPTNKETVVMVEQESLC
jgi:hypothetical protein